ncbi:hypothetical protein [Lentzea cavernae]|uniref:Integral membrane protein n=1 Tax=Lentzea cavernae TaxID=2020703 RepID=A0ABQ3LZU5_9PSEU|nr:hypothetical protein [Lentzea cavernae]GHH27943.1 hypothetical protein GCM10017774_01320 [Lentzea cavernae]
MTGQGEPHLPRLFEPGVAVLLGFVVVVGNPWLDLQVALADSGSALRVVSVLFSYPSWHVDLDSAGPFFFWFANLRTVLFVALAVMGLSRVSRWVSEAAGGKGLFVTTVGLTTLSAVVSGMVASVAVTVLLDSRETGPYLLDGQPEEFFLVQLSTSAAFGVLFGSVLGAVVALRRRTPASRERRVHAPKSLW